MTDVDPLGPWARSGARRHASSPTEETKKPCRRRLNLHLHILSEAPKSHQIFRVYLIGFIDYIEKQI